MRTLSTSSTATASTSASTCWIRLAEDRKDESTRSEGMINAPLFQRARSDSFYTVAQLMNIVTVHPPDKIGNVGLNIDERMSFP